MKKITKRLLALAVIGVMLLGLAACGSSTNELSSTTAAASAASTTAGSTTELTAEKAIDTSEHQVITFVTLGNKPTNGRADAAMVKLNEILKEKLNAELVNQYVEWTDWQTQYNLLLASGDSSLDLIGTATDWLDAWPNSKKGSFKELTEDMLKTYAPKTWAAVTPEHWEQCKYDNKIFLIPEDQYTQWTNHGFFYRGDWAKEVGLDKVGSFEDMEKYFDGVLANHKGVIPWDAAGSTNLGGLAGGYINAYTNDSVILGTTTGIFSLYYFNNNDPYTVVSPFAEGAELENFAVMMKKWADKGFWREDVLNYTGETRDLFFAGKTAADQHHTQTYVTNVRPNMDVKQPGSDVKMYPFSQPSKNLVRDIITHGAAAIAFNSKHAERALMVYDMIRNDQAAYRLYNYGIEGTDYVVTADGKLGRPDGYDDTKDGLGIDFWWGRNDSLELPNVAHYDGKKAIYDEYATYAIDYPISRFVFDPANVSTQISAVAEVCSNYLPKIAWGKTKDPKAEVAAFRDALKKAGFDEIKNEIQTQLTAFKATVAK